MESSSSREMREVGKKHETNWKREGNIWVTTSRFDTYLLVYCPWFYNMQKRREEEGGVGGKGGTSNLRISHQKQGIFPHSHSPSSSLSFPYFFKRWDLLHLHCWSCSLYLYRGLHLNMHHSFSFTLTALDQLYLPLLLQIRVQVNNQSYPCWLKLQIKLQICGQV